MVDINPEQEKQKIVDFLKKIFKEQNINNVVIGLSGGIDSMTSFYLLKEVLPPENIFVAHLYYYDSLFPRFDPVLKSAKIPEENTYNLSIQEQVEAILKSQNIEKNDLNKIRIGNIIARMRMVILFDLAKKHKTLVCGTENKTENLLGYFTRFGDQASDIEPIAHLYKTQVLELAKYLGIPDEFISQDPTAGLWQGQTDEGEFGFTYKEADQVLFLHLEQNKTLEELEAQGFKNAKLILERHNKNIFKHQAPYSIQL